MALNYLENQERLDEDQENAFLCACKREQQFLLITGAAGSGKTHLIKAIKSALTSMGKGVMLLAPTGVAAINIGGATIHSQLDIPRGIAPKHRMKENSSLRELLKHTDTVIIDEISMVLSDMMPAIEQRLTSYGPDPSKPFGGIQLIMVGDLLQLPPILKNEDREAFINAGYNPVNPYFYKELSAKNILSIVLRNSYRQTDDNFFKILSQIREGRDVAEAIKIINDRCYDPSYKNSLLTLCATKSAAKVINDEKLSELPGNTVKYSQEIKDSREYGQNTPFDIDDLFQTPLNLELKVGARVMITRNYYNNGNNDLPSLIPNGTLADVAELGENSIKVRLRTVAPGKIFDVPVVPWDRQRYSFNKEENRVVENTDISFKQFSLKLAWAITIHKSQGLTLENYVLDLGENSFTPNLAYVALSRARKFEDIHLSRPLTINDIQLDKDIIDVNHRLFNSSLRTISFTPQHRK
ncbi:MAG: DEAD/DEAH box helicase [Synergistaceae bacterium]|nr:DEAD/DEAH box helicase [Synergistaceae bacterium]